MASYKLPLNVLTPDIQEFDYCLDSSFFNTEESADVREASIDVRLKACRKAAGLAELDFSCKGTLTLPCDRCLSDMELPVDETYHLSVKSGEEFDDSRDGVLVIPEHWRELDIAPLMRDTVLLAIPIRHVHPEGQCNGQMLAALHEHQASMASDAEMPKPSDDGQEAAAEAYTDPRWNTLKDMVEKDR